MFRFSIRELMLVTLVAAMGVGWWLNYKEMNRREWFYRGLAGVYGSQLRRLGHTMELSRDGDHLRLEIPKEFHDKAGIRVGWWFREITEPDKSVMEVPSP